MRSRFRISDETVLGLALGVGVSSLLLLLLRDAFNLRLSLWPVTGAYVALFLTYPVHRNRWWLALITLALCLMPLFPYDVSPHRTGGSLRLTRYHSGCCPSGFEPRWLVRW